MTGFIPSSPLWQPEHDTANHASDYRLTLEMVSRSPAGGRAALTGYRRRP
ncbi:MAG: hypothetical protein IPP10_18100 [Candidatus Competibacteraceae bacterium]|nr:hypothetical protein [Candidatus Competibacteraceae bacterium]MBK9953318.1 hypothetical protein [Candidatus Competibacteraceae bacterium]